MRGNVPLTGDTYEPFIMAGVVVTLPKRLQKQELPVQFCRINAFNLRQDTIDDEAHETKIGLKQHFINEYSRTAVLTAPEKLTMIRLKYRACEYVLLTNTRIN